MLDILGKVTLHNFSTVSESFAFLARSQRLKRVNLQVLIEELALRKSK